MNILKITMLLSTVLSFGNASEQALIKDQEAQPKLTAIYSERLTSAQLHQINKGNYDSFQHRWESYVARKQGATPPVGCLEFDIKDFEARIALNALEQKDPGAVYKVTFSNADISVLLEEGLCPAMPSAQHTIGRITAAAQRAYENKERI